MELFQIKLTFQHKEGGSCECSDTHMIISAPVTCIAPTYESVVYFTKAYMILLTLTVLVTTIYALQHFETG